MVITCDVVENDLSCLERVDRTEDGVVDPPEIHHQAEVFPSGLGNKVGTGQEVSLMLDIRYDALLD